MFLLCLIAVGFLTAKTRIVDVNARTTLTDLVLNVFLPGTILASFFDTSPSELPSMGIIILIAVGTIVFSFLLSFFLYHRTGKDQKKVLLFATIIPNASFIGIPIIESIYGTGALSYTAAYLIPLRTALWTVGLIIFSGGKGNFKQIILHPCMIATYLGVVILFTGFRPPDVLFRLIYSIGNCTTPVSMMVIGCVLGHTKSKNILTPLTLYFSFIRLILIPLAVMGILLIIRPIPSLITEVSVVLAGTPAAVNTVILADKFNADKALASKIVFVSTLLSMFTIPALVWLLGLLY